MVSQTLLLHRSLRSKRLLHWLPLVKPIPTSSFPKSNQKYNSPPMIVLPVSRANSSSSEDGRSSHRFRLEPSVLPTRPSVASGQVLQEIDNLQLRSRKSQFDLPKSELCSQKSSSRSLDLANQSLLLSQIDLRPLLSQSRQFTPMQRHAMRPTQYLRIVTLVRFLSLQLRRNLSQHIELFPLSTMERSLPMSMIELWPPPLLLPN